MDTGDLLALVRLQCLIEPSNVDYTDNVLLRELHNSLTTKFERMVLDAHANYWIQNFDYTTTVGLQEYRLPPRAVGVSKIELGLNTAASTGFWRLPEVTEDHINIFQSSASSRGQPARYLLRGDRIFIDPPPDSTYTLRLWYYVRPSRLTPAQTTAGIVSAVNTSTLTVTFTGGIPLGYSATNTGSALTSASIVDIVGAGGWRELQLVSSPLVSINSTTAVFPAGTDLTSVQAGDALRQADQSEWPQLPEDFHRCLADVSSVKVLIQRDFQQKAGGYGQDVSADLSRFSQLIAQRVEEDPVILRADLPSLRGGYRGWWGYR